LADASVNATVRGTVPAVGEPVNEAVGADSVLAVM
jgi:hypothetical protein